MYEYNDDNGVVRSGVDRKKEEMMQDRTMAIRGSSIISFVYRLPSLTTLASIASLGARRREALEQIMVTALAQTQHQAEC